MSSTACRRLRSFFTPPLHSTNTATSGATKNTTTPPTSKQDTFQKIVRKFKKSSESDQFRTSRYDIYLNTVLRLAKFKRFAMIEEIIEHQQNFTDITSEPFTCRLMSLYGKVGMFDHAHKLFDKMPELNCPRTVYSFNTLLSACIDAGKFSEFEKIVKDYPNNLGITRDLISYNIIIKGFCKMGALDNGVMVLEELVKNGFNPSLITFNTLLNGFYGSGKSSDGDRIWDRIVEMNVVPDIRSYNAKLLGLALEKKTKEAVELVEEMRRKGIELDRFSFNGLIKGFVEDGNLEGAKLWYDEMRKSDGCAPDKVLFETLVPFLCEKGDIDFAYEILQEVLSRNCNVRVTLLQLVVDGLVKQSKIEEAEKLILLKKKARIQGSLAMTMENDPNTVVHNQD
ncbi:pentatricopeptide repeat-containing protein At3g13160, mitochondrial-like [Mercurialis annua]|uniref:pentatricopeptide repeat-containing protein At3g13160, mitochondrial-like n=1 Tax=Mercurialis annua TaxID=3986 RepID=UPI00215F6A2C|nr:pentatricopeptide repeat-containing protein At3g13160, mitochondrial-like [Mercurialis annua]